MEICDPPGFPRLELHECSAFEIDGQDLARQRRRSGDLKVTEQFHRIDHDHMELTLTVDDPKMYKEPWLALNKFPLRLQPRGFDIREQCCSPSDLAEYNKEIGDPILTPHK